MTIAVTPPTLYIQFSSLFGHAEHLKTPNIEDQHIGLLFNKFKGLTLNRRPSTDSHKKAIITLAHP